MLPETNVAAHETRGLRLKKKKTPAMDHSPFAVVDLDLFCSLLFPFFPKKKRQNLDSDVDDFGPDLMGNDADREYLRNLNELEREGILAERAERRETEVNRRRTLRQRAIAAGTYKAPARDEDEAARKKAAEDAARGGPASKKVQQRAALQDLKAQRAARAAGGGAGASAAAAAAAARAREDRGDDDDEEFEEAIGGASDDEDDDDVRRRVGDGRRRRTHDGNDNEEEDEDAEYPDVVKAQLRRSILEKWAAEPFLPRYAPGCTVRVALNGKYLAAEVTAVVARPHGTYTEPGLPPTPCPYKLAGAVNSPSYSSSPAATASSQRGPTMTDRWLEISRCGRRRLVPFTIVSNQPIAEAELEEWEALQSREGFQPYSRAQARGAAEGLRAAAAYKYTEADVSAMIAAKKKAAADAAAAAAAVAAAVGGGGLSPAVAIAGVTNVAAERARLIAARDFAFAAGDKEDALAASRDLEALAAASAAAGARRDAGGRDAALAALNARNARQNVANSLVDVGTAMADAAADARAAAAEAAALVSPDGKGAAAVAAALASSAKVRERGLSFFLETVGWGERGGAESGSSERASEAAASEELFALSSERASEAAASERARSRADRLCQGVKEERTRRRRSRRPRRDLLPNLFFLTRRKKQTTFSQQKRQNDTQVADPFRRRETRPKHMWATSGSRNNKADENDGDATKRAEQEIAAAAEAEAARAAEESALSPSRAAARASRLLEPTFQRPIPALEDLDVSGIEAELALAKRRGGGGVTGGAAGATPAAGGFSEIARALLGADWRPTPLPGAAALRRISLAEYKRRQGLA